jgi:uncharacterized Zn-binding protein involved in type VI secretion
MDRLHVLRLPDTTACGRVGRRVQLGHKTALVQGDLILRLGDRNSVTCKQCIARIERHGYSLDWAGVGEHDASVAREKRRRHRRRSR